MGGNGVGRGGPSSWPIPAPDDPRLDPFAQRERVRDVLHSHPPAPAGERVDWESDPRPFGELLKAWHAARGLSRDEAAAELRVPRASYDSWCSGRACEREASLRRLMMLLEHAG